MDLPKPQAIQSKPVIALYQQMENQYSDSVSKGISRARTTAKTKKKTV